MIVSANSQSKGPVLVLVFGAFVVYLPLICANLGLERPADGRTERDSGDQGNDELGPKPCCLPYRFQAVIANLPTFSAQAKQVTHLYRDWEMRLQIQETVTFDVNGIQSSVRKVIMDYLNGIQYIVSGDRSSCQMAAVDSGMLEPCMPDDSVYLGKSYIGQYDNQAHFDAWYFTRKDLNRNIEMTIAVTSDRCVPVSEHITGTLGASPVDALVLFTNLTEEVPASAFYIPDICLNSGPM